MARSIETIQNEIIATLNTDGIAVSGSTTSVRRKWTYAMAFAGNMLERQQDQFKEDVTSFVKAMYPHRIKWYETMTLAYQHGFNLLPDSDQYDNSGHTAAEIEAAKVIKYAAVVKIVNQFGRVRIRIKAAIISGSDLVPLPTPILNGLKAYWARIEPAGVVVDITTGPPDDLKQEWNIFYDPLIFDATSADVAARFAIKEYLKLLPYNGLFVNVLHQDYVQKVEGIVIPEIISCQARYGALPFTNVQTEYPTDAGYLRFIDDTFLIINCIPHIAIQ
jgi:hypothetical protein